LPSFSGKKHQPLSHSETDAATKYNPERGQLSVCLNQLSAVGNGSTSGNEWKKERKSGMKYYSDNSRDSSGM